MPVTAADLVSDLTQLLYVAAFVGTVVELVRRPRRASVDAALFFGILAVIVVTAQSLRYLQVSLSPVATTVLVAMLLALPYALLRLADDYRGVPRRASAAAIAGLVLSIALYLGVPPPYPAAMTLVIVAYFIAVLVYCAVIFGRGALASAGTTRSRMRAVAIGTGLLALTIVVSGLRAFAPADLSGGLAVASALVALGSGVAFFVGFAPPDMLLRFWPESILREFIGAAARLADTSDLAEVVRRIEVTAGRALGAGTVSIALDDGDGSQPATEATDPLIALAAKAVRARNAVTIEVPSGDLAPAGARPVGHGART